MSHDGPVLTQKMKLHLNGGAMFSVLEYEIYADGKPTGILLIERTDGSPNYHYTARELVHGTDVFDLMKADQGDPVKWVRARITEALRTP